MHTCTLYTSVFYPTDPDDHQVMQDHQSLAPPTTVSARLIPPHSSQAVNLPTPDHTTAKPRSNEAKQPHLQMAPIQDRHVHIRGILKYRLKLQCMSLINLFFLFIDVLCQTDAF